MPNSPTCPHQAYCEMREQSDWRFISHLTRNTFAIILAGGRGSRLRQLTDFRTKPAVPFAGKFRILDFTLSKLKIIVLMVLWNQHQAMDTLILEELLSGNDARFLH